MNQSDRNNRHVSLQYSPQISIIDAARVRRIQAAVDHQAYSRATPVADRKELAGTLWAFVAAELPEGIEDRILQYFLHAGLKNISEPEFGAPEKEIAWIN